MISKFKRGLNDIFKQGQKYERRRILIKVLKQQRDYIKSGMLNGSCGLSWLIEELKDG
jgi:hypothetical protein